MKVWAMIYPDGKILADSTFRDEAHVWRIGLGWPDKEEIEAAKKKGHRAEQVEIHIPGVQGRELPDLSNPLQQECYMDALRAEAEKP